MATDAVTNVESGVVIAGYGEDEVFPSLREYRFFGVVGGHLSYHPLRSNGIGQDVSALIVPLAQGADMAHRFMEGVDPWYQAVLERSLREVWVRSLGGVVDAIEELGDAQKDCYREQAKQAGEELLGRYIDDLKRLRQERFWGPIVDVVASLPKDELAEMAESLVNLASLKMRVSGEQQTVGGPIDVAVISKGDGLIWIKRKHYFDPSLNPHYFINSGRERHDENDESKEAHREEG